MDEIVSFTQNLMAYIERRGDTLNAETQAALRDFLSNVFRLIEFETNRIQQERAQAEREEAERQAPPAAAPVGATPSADAQLLWILAGQQEDAFISYLQTFPTDATRNLLANPEALQSTIQQLSQMMPPGEPPIIDGIQRAPLNSSNVWGFRYDPQSRRLTVRFQGGSEYDYEGVPENIFRAFASGSAAATTRGQNQYGRWWVGKNPSLGAAMHQYIRAGRFPYHRVR